MLTKKQCNLFLQAVVIFVLLLTCSFSCFANQYYSTETTPEERAVFAFFKATNLAPDYEYWITSSHPGYENLSNARKKEFLLKETLRLGHGFGAFDKENDFIVLTVNVIAKYIPENPENGELPRMTFKFKNLRGNASPTFDFAYGQEILSLLLPNLSVFSDLKLQPLQQEAVLEKIPYEGDYFDATLNIHVKVIHADLDNPVVLDDMTQRIMKGNIAYMNCVFSSYQTDGDIVIWDYIAPWHKENHVRSTAPEEEKYPHPYDLFKD